MSDKNNSGLEVVGALDPLEDVCTKAFNWHQTRRYRVPLVRLSDAEAALAAKQETWQPIETAPVGREMFVVKAFNVCNGFTGSMPYTSDPWCVWQEKAGEFLRWPHHFAPTHWMPLPKDAP